MKHQKRTFCSPFVDKKHHEDGQRVDERLQMTGGFICNSRDITIKSKERIGFVVVAFSLKIWVAMRFTAKTRGYLKCKISIGLT